MVPIHTAFTFFVVTLGLSVASTAVSPSEKARYESGFSSLQQSTRTFQANLRQTLSLQGISKPIVSTGMLFYQTPDRLLLRFSEPEAERLIVNGTRTAMQKRGRPLQIEDSSTSSVRRSHAANLLDFFSSSAERWNKDFNVSMTRDGNRLLVHLKPWQTPTSTSQGVDEVITTLQLPSYEVLKIEVSVSGNNKVSYEFSNIQRNVPMKADLFGIPPKP